MKRIAIIVLGLTLGGVSATAAQATPEAHDGYSHLSRINRASLVMLVETGLVEPELAARIARAIERIDAEQGQPGARRSSDYLVFEARLLELEGPEASRLHTGRSRQDIGSTLRRLAIREALLGTYEALLEVRGALLEVAAEHRETVIPGYTHGVQAQPTTLAHYLLAFAAAFERDAQRLEETWARSNLSPMGAMVLSTSGFALDRPRLAELLGFDGVIENSYDANLVSSVDSKTELAGVLATSALQVGLFAEDLHTQYHDPAPWMLLDPSQTGVSSSMPQKQNPRGLEKLRVAASEVVAGSHAVELLAHNTSTGMADYRPANQIVETADKAQRMYRAAARVVGQLRVDPERSLAEVEADYAMTSEVADALLRIAAVPFRTGHHYASELTRYGREQGKKPSELTYDEMRRLYAEANDGAPLPLGEAEMRAALDPRRMVMSRRGLGGPQPAEVERMLAARRRRLDASREWLAATRGRLAAAGAALDQAFGQLAAGAGP